MSRRCRRGTKPDITSRTLTFNIDNDQTVIFPVGDAGPSKPGKGIEALQLIVGGLVFSVLLAMAALGLSMVFGTTGLTNFAHGELITFGALAAFFIDQLPGKIEIGGTEGHGHRRGDGCVPGRRRVRLGERQGALASAPAPWHRGWWR